MAKSVVRPVSRSYMLMLVSDLGTFLRLFILVVNWNTPSHIQSTHKGKVIITCVGAPQKMAPVSYYTKSELLI